MIRKVVNPVAANLHLNKPQVIPNKKRTPPPDSSFQDFLDDVMNEEEGPLHDSD